MEGSAVAAFDPTSEEMRRRARLAGVLFLITFVTSIAARVLYDPVQNDADFIFGGGGDGGVRLGAFLEVLLIISNIGTAVVLYPVVKRWGETLALSYVAARVMEGAIIAIGIISALAVVTLREDFAGADAASLAASRETLVAIQDWTFLLGPAFCAAIGNGMILGYLMYRSGLVPRGMTYLGLVGGPLLLAASIGVLFGVFEQSDIVPGIATVPEFFWELSLGLYLAIVGFRAPAGR
jgi:hypothetical protein